MLVLLLYLLQPDNTLQLGPTHCGYLLYLFRFPTLQTSE